MNTNITVISATAAIVAAIISFWNVNRQQRANHKNDVEKFKREMNLKTCDEFLEKIFNARISLRNARMIEQNLKIFNLDLKSYTDFSEYLWSIAEDQSVYEFKLYFERREIVLSRYSKEVDSIFQTWEQINSLIWRFKINEGKTDQELLLSTKQIIEKIDSTLELLLNLQKEIQNEFLGEIYNRKLT